MKLKDQVWILGSRIDGGGFGKVYDVQSDNGDQAVAKLVPKDPGADRELLFANLAGARNIIPILDQGEDGENWVLVMPKADKSLRRYLADASGRLVTSDVIWILSDIATALTSIDGRVVHRDLKPENVLLFNGHWCLADFGISRYAEATTGPDTRKYAMTSRYAAPEQWRFDRTTTATDVYAFGVIAYELLSGTSPFAGPDFREQHLHDTPPQLNGVPSALTALVEECLYKAPQARPKPSDVVNRLTRAGGIPASGGLAQLQEANRAIVLRRSAEDRQASERLSEDERRAALAGAAKQNLNRISDALGTAITDAASSAIRSVGQEIGWNIQLNQAELLFSSPQIPQAKPWDSWSTPTFTVIAFSSISLEFPANRQYEGRSHSLWYCDAQETDKFQWFETAFMISPPIASHRAQDPFSLAPGEDAAKALGNSTTQYQLAWPFTPLIAEDLDEFISRWAGWFAAAAQGQLNHPSSMPEREPRGSWRQH